MAIVGLPRTFNKKYAFKFEIDGFRSLGFSKVGPLKAKIGKAEQWEGGSMIASKSASRVTFDDITCERGSVPTDPDLYAWFLTCINAAANVGLPDPLYKRNGSLIQLDRSGSISATWMIFGMFPVEVDFGEWDNTSDENLIERMVLAYDFFQKII